MPTHSVDLTDARDTGLMFKARQRGTTPAYLLAELVARALDPLVVEAETATLAALAAQMRTLPEAQQADLSAAVESVQAQLVTRREAEQAAELAAKARELAEHAAGADLRAALAVKAAYDKADAKATKADIAAGLADARSVVPAPAFEDGA